MMRACCLTPPTHMNCCSSSTTVTGTNATLLASLTVRTPSSPFDEKVSAERGTRVAGVGASGTVTSAVMPSGM